MQIILREQEIKEALALYLCTPFFRKSVEQNLKTKAKDISEIKLRRRAVKSEDVGSVVITLRERDKTCKTA